MSLTLMMFLYLSSSLAWMKLFGNDSLVSAQGYLNLLQQINNYLSRQLSNLDSKSSVVMADC